MHQCVVFLRCFLAASYSAKPGFNFLGRGPFACFGVQFACFVNKRAFEQLLESRGIAARLSVENIASIGLALYYYNSI